MKNAFFKHLFHFNAGVPPTPGMLEGGGGTPPPDGGAAGGGGGAGGGGSGGGAPPPPPVPFFKGLYGDDGKIDKTALDRLPDHLKGHKDLFGKYDTVDALLAGFGNAHSMAVKKALAPLKGDEPPEVVAERNAMLDTILNVPKDPKGYGIAKPADIPDFAWDANFADQLAAWGVKNHISPAAMKDGLAMLSSSTKAQLAAGQKQEAEYWTGQQRAFEEAIARDGGDLEEAAGLAARGAERLGIDPKAPIFKNATVRLACLRMARLVSEDTLVAGETPGAQKQLTGIEQARDIMRNPQNPHHKAFSDPIHPDHERVKDMINELYRSSKPVTR